MAALTLAARNVQAANPLITDDTGTQGAGKAQLEFTGEYNRSEQDGAVTKTITAPTMPVLTVGVLEDVDAVAGIGWQQVKTEADGVTDTQSGANDLGVDIKWRFHENSEWSLALKPGATFATGDAKKGLGNGKATGRLYLLATRQAGPLALHLNLGYIRNNNSLGQRQDLFHLSGAGEWKCLPSFKLVGDLGIESRRQTGGQDPAYALAGVIWSPLERLDLDAGIKKVMNSPAKEYALSTGVTTRF